MIINSETNSEEELLTVTEPFVFKNPISKYTPNTHLGIEKISLDESLTRIDFVYITPKLYHYGGWMNIDPESYIRPFGTDIQLKMIKAINIPIAPAKYYFKNSGQVHHFSLFFPAIPKNIMHIDIIEKLSVGHYFNFFKVALQHNEPTLIRIINEN